jgi:hypothetical protein
MTAVVPMPEVEAIGTTEPARIGLTQSDVLIRRIFIWAHRLRGIPPWQKNCQAQTHVDRGCLDGLPLRSTADVATVVDRRCLVRLDLHPLGVTGARARSGAILTASLRPCKANPYGFRLADKEGSTSRKNNVQRHRR